MSDRASSHMKQTFLTLGMVLLVAVLVGTIAELRLRAAKGAPGADQGAVETAPGAEQMDAVSMGTPLSVAFFSVLIALPVVGALVAVPVIGTHLVHRLYVARDLSEAHEILNRLVFGRLSRRPYLVIKEGRLAYGKSPFARDMGGPATLIIYNDTAVVTEQYGCTKRVLGAGIHDAEHFERVWEIIDLRPQRWVLPVSALTKEGIPINCEADVSFQIDDQPHEPGREVHIEEPYPFAEDAVFRAATNKWIREPEREDARMDWVARVVVGFTEGILRDILAEYRLDWLIAPPQPGQEHPRKEIRQRLEEALRENARKVGAKLLDVQIGKIEVKAQDEETAAELAKIVSQQRVEAWHADWETKELASKAEGEAELLRMEMAQIQAQAEMVVTLTEALQSAITSQEAIEPYLLAWRFVEALRWMSYNTYTREFMPPEAMRTLKRLQDMLKPQAGMPGKQRSLPSEGA